MNQTLIQSRLEAIRPTLLDWLEGLRVKSGGWGRWPYHAKMIRPWSLQASSIAILLLDVLGELNKVDAGRRAEAVDFLRGCQDPRDGLFKDPLEDESCHAGPHTWEQIFGQRHGAAVAALALLGGEPKHPLPAAQFVDFTHVDPAHWTLHLLDWSNPWSKGESWSRAIRAYLDNASPGEDRANDPRLLAAFEALEREITDPRTGMPSRRMDPPRPSVAMAGLFKVMSGYFAVGRPVPHAEAAIDATLSLQHEDGEFEFRDNMCINWDALWVLRELDRQLDGGHRHRDIVDAGDRCARMLLRKYRQEDGGFAFNGPWCARNHHSIVLSPERHRIGDMLGTRMSVLCLTYADEWSGAS